MDLLFIKGGKSTQQIIFLQQTSSKLTVERKGSIYVHAMQ